MSKLKRWGCLCLATLLLLCGIFIQDNINVSAETITICRVVGTDVNIREKPTTKSSSLGKASNCEVTYISKTDKKSDGYWYYIEYNGKKGYIREDFIEIQEYATDDTFEATLKLFPESYHEGLIKLHAQYPNWKFTVDKVPLSFTESVNLQLDQKQTQSKYHSWRSMGFGAYDWVTGKYSVDNGGWYTASRELIAYYMDPRNFLDSAGIIMFLNQGYDKKTQNKDGVRTIIEGSFLEKGYGGDKDAYVDDIMAAADKSGVSPYVLASMIIQEQGSAGTSSMISGKHATYKGYYNFFNVNASGTDEAAVINSGLSFAKAKGWNTREKAIIGGAEFYANGYIKEGQNTYFYKNYNVLYPKKIWHQYAQAVHDSHSLAKINSKTYTKNTKATLTFRIPVYPDMPDEASAKPKEVNRKNNYYFSDIKAGSALTPSFYRFTYDYTLQVSGNTTIGVSVPEGASYSSASSFKLKKGDNAISLVVTSESGYKNTYNITVDSTGAYTLTVKVDGKFEEEKPKYNLGDVNNDGKISLSDLAAVQKHLLGVKLISNDLKEAADINKDGKISLSDLAAIQKHLLGVKEIGG